MEGASQDAWNNICSNSGSLLYIYPDLPLVSRVCGGNIMRFAKRLSKIPPYAFVELDRRKKEKLLEGIDVIDLGVGDPDIPTPKFIIEAMKKAIDDPANHRYPFGRGKQELREAISSWYARRFGVSLDPGREIAVLIGSKEGLTHLPLALLDEGDTALIPDPGYPAYRSGVIFAGAKPVYFPLSLEDNYLPKVSSFPRRELDRTKLLFLNYPNNPTSAVANGNAFEEIVHWAHDNNVVVAHDAAYSELYSGEKPISFLQTPGAKEIGVEFHSFSKTFNMTGWRIGWICGNPDVINALSQIKENIDSGVFGAIQAAALVALTSPAAETEAGRMRDIYAERRNVLVPGLEKNGWHVFHSNATFYAWAGVPDSESDVLWAERLLEKWGIVATPGSALGEHGGGFVRFSLTQPVERIKQALDRMK